jgi:hypothetical protein
MRENLAGRHLSAKFKTFERGHLSAKFGTFERRKKNGTFERQHLTIFEFAPFWKLLSIFSIVQLLLDLIDAPSGRLLLI